MCRPCCHEIYSNAQFTFPILDFLVYIDPAIRLHILHISTHNYYSSLLQNYMSTFKKSTLFSFFKTKISLIIILTHLLINISAARTVHLSQNFDKKSASASSNLRQKLLHLDKDIFPMLVKGRNAPPSAPSHKGHKVHAMLKRPP